MPIVIHEMVWMWIGGMAMISPIGLVVFKRLFTKVENHAIDARLSQSEKSEDS